MYVVLSATVLLGYLVIYVENDVFICSDLPDVSLPGNKAVSTVLLGEFVMYVDDDV